MVLLKTGAWVLVADGRKALFLRNSGDTRDYDLRVVWHQSMDDLPSRAQGSDRPGRSVSSVGGHRAALQETDWHQLAEDRFAAEVAAILNKAAGDGAFDEIVVVAAPAVLGELRAAMSPDAARHVVAEIHKTLTDQPIDRIETVLKAALDAD
jgi:protein required for attachment to host cells